MGTERGFPVGLMLAAVRSQGAEQGPLDRGGRSDGGEGKSRQEGRGGLREGEKKRGLGGRKSGIEDGSAGRRSVTRTASLN